MDIFFNVIKSLTDYIQCIVYYIEFVYTMRIVIDQLLINKKCSDLLLVINYSCTHIQISSIPTKLRTVSFFPTWKNTKISVEIFNMELMLY